MVRIFITGKATATPISQSRTARSSPGQEGPQGHGVSDLEGQIQRLPDLCRVLVSTDANSGIFIRCEDPKKPGAKICYERNIFDTWPDPSYGTGAIVYHAEVNPMTGAKNGDFGQGPRSFHHVSACLQREQ